MNDRSKFSLVSKLTPIICSSVLEYYLLTVDFCCPHRHVNYTGDNEHDYFKNLDSSYFPYEVAKFHSIGFRVNREICSCLKNFAHDSKVRKLKIKIDILLFSIILFELERSRTFRLNVLSNLHTFSRTHCKKVQNNTSLCSVCKRRVQKIDVTVHLTQTKKDIVDYQWNKKLEILANEKCELENAMAWLSTLGGAFSALGDTFIECAEKAGIISMKQFHLALRVGDPITISRCKIYLAMSLLQRGYYSKTKKMMRELYQFSVGPEGSKDFRLRNMCLAVWNRLKYVLSERKRNGSNLHLKASIAPHR